MNELNEQVVAEFRANGGVVREALGGHFKDVHLLLVHYEHRRTGKPNVTPLLYATDGDGYVLVASNGGDQKEPRWVEHVTAMPEVTVELGDRTLKAKPTLVEAGPERDRLYAVLMDYWPDIREYETHGPRVFPVIRLDPVE